MSFPQPKRGYAHNELNMLSELQILESNDASISTGRAGPSTSFPTADRSVRSFSQDTMMGGASGGMSIDSETSQLLLDHIDANDLDDSDGDDLIPQKKVGRRKIKIEFIQDRIKRHVTFSKRKGGLMKKAYELSTLTGTQVLLLVASETGYVYTFATPKFQPIVSQGEGKSLIQRCLGSSSSAGTPQTPQSADRAVSRSKGIDASRKPMSMSPKSPIELSSKVSIFNYSKGPYQDMNQCFPDVLAGNYQAYSTENVFLNDFSMHPPESAPQQFFCPPSAYWPVMPNQSDATRQSEFPTTQNDPLRTYGRQPTDETRNYSPSNINAASFSYANMK